MIPRTLACIAVFLIMLPTSVVADVAVSPDNWSPKIHFKATKTDHGKPSAPNSESSSTSRKRWPYAKYTCTRDADDLWVCEPVLGDQAPDTPTLTEGDIIVAVREIGLPRLDVTVEPGDSTLVNAATNFYTDPEAFARSIDLLGFDVDLQASPITYTWIHGDGSRADTTQPGQPYPDLDVTHRYREPATVVRPHVDVTYRVRYRVDGGAWTTLGQTLTATGPSTDLAVNEAAPVLTAP